MRTAFDGDGLVDDVAFDPRGRGQAHFQTTHTADHAAIDHDIIGDNFAADGGRFANGQQMGADIAFNNAFNLNIASGLQVADHVRSEDNTDADALPLGADGVKSIDGFVADILWGLRFCLPRRFAAGFVDFAFRKHLALP